jgi:hypothetical protein
MIPFRVMEGFPYEKYIDLENNPYLMGRVTVHHVKEDYHAEVDIIHRESHKIFKHVDIVYNQYSSEEALITGVQRLRQFLEKIEKAAEPKSKDHLH